jgi:Insertion element 4 transposase N-terminal
MLAKRMSNATPFFKAFGPLLFGRSGRGGIKKLARLNSLQELYELFGHLIPERLLAASEAGANSRERVFTPQVTFWAFVAQILSPGSSCREMVRRVEAWWQRAAGESGSLSGSTSAYCQARARLDPDALDLVSGHLCWSLWERGQILTPDSGSRGGSKREKSMARQIRIEFLGAIMQLFKRFPLHDLVDSELGR